MWGCFVRGVALTNVIHFASMLTQITHLLGREGLYPAQLQLTAWEAQSDSSPVALYLRFPTLLWICSEDTMLFGLPLVGVCAGVVACLGSGQPSTLALLTCYILGLSITTVGADFFMYPWDLMLLELTCLAALVPPLDGLRVRWRVQTPTRLAVRLLLFRLMLGMGLKKFYYNELDSEYTREFLSWQPMPTTLAWHAYNSLPSWLTAEGGLWALYVTEMILPWFVWGPWLCRIAAMTAFFLMSLWIQATGNFGTFNLLTIVLSITLMDPACSVSGAAHEPHLVQRAPRWHTVFTGAITALLIFVGALLSLRLPLYGDQGATFLSNDAWLFYPTAYYFYPPVLIDLLRAVAPFRLVHAYGIFRGGPEHRSSITIEVSDTQGKSWVPVPPKWQIPVRFAPYQPRLVHQLFYEGLHIRFGLFSGVNPHLVAPFLPRLALQLLQGSPAACSLMGANFSQCTAGGAHRMLRILRHDHQRFTTHQELARTGKWYTDVERPRVWLGPVRAQQMQHVVDCHAYLAAAHTHWALSVRERQGIAPGGSLSAWDRWRHLDLPNQWGASNLSGSAMVESRPGDCLDKRTFKWLLQSRSIWLYSRLYNIEHLQDIESDMDSTGFESVLARFVRQGDATKKQARETNNGTQVQAAPTTPTTREL